MKTKVHTFRVIGLEGGEIRPSSRILHAISLWGSTSSRQVGGAVKDENGRTKDDEDVYDEM
ncbi:MAG: hypothetical protein FWG50_06780 [Kiritimatiellaeota bacterium]|nr:hypothetical protein [Kiritimatiellota bacterium]